MDDNTQSLSGALNNLIKAYEELRKENINLKVEIKELRGANAKMQDKLDGLSSKNSKQSQDINGMVSKINSLLKLEPAAAPISTPAKKVEEVQEQSLLGEDMEEDESIVHRSDISTMETKTKIDLNKMESLLNGFGGNS